VYWRSLKYFTIISAGIHQLKPRYLLNIGQSYMQVCLLLIAIRS
jgi:hypothetical protein